MASGTWGDPNVYTKAETDSAIAQSAAIQSITIQTKESFTVAANGIVTLRASDFKGSIPSGYKPIAISRVDVNTNLAIVLFATPTDLGASTYILGLHNIGNASVTAAAYMTLVCVPT